MTVATPAGPRAFRVAGVYRDYSNDRGTVVMDRALYLALFGDARITSVAVLAQPGVDANELRRRILVSAADRYALSISTNRELRKEALRIFDRTFAVTRALEAIAVGVAVLGIANALLASAVERRRAFGLLRAIGANGPQIRRATLSRPCSPASSARQRRSPRARPSRGSCSASSIRSPSAGPWPCACRSRPSRARPLLVLGASVLAGVVPGRIAAAVNPAAALQEE